MSIRMHAVAVKQLPEKLNAKQARLFFDEMESWFNVDHPRIVLDCSRVHSMDRSAMHLLLCCLEEAMKRNGDVKLARIPEDAKASLTQMGLIGLFEVFDTNADAVESFHRPRTHAASHGNLAGAQRPSTNAA
jgi:anti-sigma B factor antagonist